MPFDFFSADLHFIKHYNINKEKKQVNFPKKNDEDDINTTFVLNQVRDIKIL